MGLFLEDSLGGGRNRVLNINFSLGFYAAEGLVCSRDALLQAQAC